MPVRMPTQDDLSFSIPESRAAIRAPRDMISPAIGRAVDTISREADADRDLDISIRRKQRTERDALDLTRARADWQTRRANESAVYDYANDQDYGTWKQRFDKKILKHRDSSAALIGSPRLRARFEAETDADIAESGLAISNRARGIDHDKRKAEGLAGLDASVNAAATLPREQSGKVLGELRANIDNLAGAGVLLPHEAVSERQRLTHKYAAARAAEDVTSDPTNAQRWLSGEEEPAPLIQNMEGFRSEPYMDKGSWRIGFGSDTITMADGSHVAVKPGMRISRKDAIRDLKRREVEFQDGIIKKVGADAWARLPENAKAGLTSFAYNYGSLTPSLAAAVKSGNVQAIADAVRDRATDNQGENAKRRHREAAIIEGSAGNEYASLARPDYYEFLTPEDRLRFQGAAETAIGQSDQQVIQAARQAEADAKAAAAVRKGELDLGIEQGQISREAIINDPVIDDGDKAVLIRRWEEREKDNISAGAVWEAIQKGVPLPDNAGRGLDALLKNVGGTAALAKSDPKAVATVGYMWQKAEAIAPDAKRTLTGMLKSGSQDSMLAGLAIMDQLQRQNPVAFDREFDAPTTKALTYYQDRIGYASPEEVYKGLRAQSDPAVIKAREPLVEKGRKEAEKNYDADKIAGKFGAAWVPFGIGAPGVSGGAPKGQVLDSAMLETDFHQLYGEAYADDPENAEKNAMAMLAKKWGPSEINNGDVMRYPPERYIPKVDGKYEWATKALEKDLKELGYTVEPASAIAGLKLPDTVRNYSLQPIPLTESDIAAGRNPHYAVIVENPETGEWDAVLDKNGGMLAYQFDPKPHLDEAREKILKAGNKIEADRKARLREALDNGFMAIPERPPGLVQGESGW